MRVLIALLALTVPAVADVDALHAELSPVMHGSRTPVLEAIRADCRFRHPDSASVYDACVERQAALFNSVRDEWQSRRIEKARGIVMFCMDQSRSLNGFDWQEVSWCFERTVVSLGG
jgi:hypothetical protein